MNGWQELVSNIVTSVTWPLVVLILGLTFRKNLRGLLGRIKKFEGLGANVEFGESVKQLDEAADSVEVELAKRAQTVETEESTKKPDERESFAGRQLPLRHLVEVAQLSPSAAIVDAWREVEVSLLDYWRAARIVLDLSEDQYRSPVAIVNALKVSDMITGQQFKLLQNLRRTRNAVAHGQTNPSEGQSLAYVDAAGLAIQTLTSDRWALERGEYAHRMTHDEGLPTASQRVPDAP